MYLINNSLKNIKTITLLFTCFFTFNVLANDEYNFLLMNKATEQGYTDAEFFLGACKKKATTYVDLKQ
jgi:hypothetical protein